MNTEKTGYWSDWTFELDENARRIFEATIPPIGVGYTPLAVATQVVAGTNWCFLTKAQVIYPDAPERALLIYVYEPLTGPAHITRMDEVRP